MFYAEAPWTIGFVLVTFWSDLEYFKETLLSKCMLFGADRRSCCAPLERLQRRCMNVWMSRTGSRAVLSIFISALLAALF